MPARSMPSPDSLDEREAPSRVERAAKALSLTSLSDVVSVCVCYSLHRVYFELVTVYNVLDVA